jgi:integrase
MAHLRRVFSIRYTDPTTGKRVAKGTPGAVKTKAKSEKWYAANVPGHPPGKRIPLSAHRRTAEQMLAELITKGERGLMGLPQADAISRPLPDYLADYRTHMGATGSVPRHVSTTVNRLAKIVRAAKLHVAGDLLHAGARLRVEQAVGDLAEENGFGGKTVDYYLRDFRTFARWLHEDVEVLPRNPFAGRVRRKGKRAKADAKPGRRRRVLTPNELARLIDAASASPKTVRHLCGKSRAALYATAAGTGFRSEELSKLTTASFDLAADPPVLIAPGRDTKNAAPARLPLPPGLVALLTPLLAGRKPTDRVWPGLWWQKSAKMLRRDLNTAGIPYRIDTPAGPEYADFHALRHFFTTQIVGTGASVKAAQKLARHSTPVLTIGTYTHTSERELAEAVNKLPVLGSGSDVTADWSREKLVTALIVMATAYDVVLGGQGVSAHGVSQ